MHILLVADGRSPITHRWIETVRALGHTLTLLSSFPCGQQDGVERLITLPVAFSQLASRQGQSSAPPTTGGINRKSRLISPSSSVFLKARYLLGPLTVRIAGSRFRQIVDATHPDFVHALRIPFEGMLASYTPPKTPMAVSIWGNDLTLHAPSTSGMSLLTRRTLRRADGLLADVQRDLRLASKWGFSPDRPARVVPGNGGIDMATLQRERSPLPVELEARLPAGLPMVINPRGVRAYTRTDTFFQAIPLVLERCPQVGFVCPIMQGQPQAESWLQRLKLDKRTVLLPALSQGQLWELFSRSIASVSITTHDGTPNTLLEAMACGSFPIAGDIESLREWIIPGENGLLVDPGRPEALADAILQTLESPDLRAKAAKLNLDIIAARAEVSIVRPQIESFFQTLMGLR